MSDPDIITTREAAALKGVAIQNIRRAIQRGALAGHRRGGRWLVNRQSREAWAPVGRRPKMIKRPYPWRQPPPDDSPEARP